MSWFYRNQIKADKEALARKRKKNEEAKAKLEAIMATKHKQLEFADGLEDMSIASSELSELDSDVHSMASLKSCAESWIEDAGYKAPAEQWVKNSAVTVLVRAWVCMQAGTCYLETCHWNAWLYDLPSRWMCCTCRLHQGSRRSKRTACTQQQALTLHTRSTRNGQWLGCVAPERSRPAWRCCITAPASGEQVS